MIENENGEREVKIDYKLSRFFDPKLDKPGPMLKHLLSCHPDIVNGRPLDFRSDMWSLGKIFVELLTPDFETYDHLAKVDELPLPHEAQVLFKTMLADAPDLRPRSMSEVATALGRIKDGEIEEAKRRQLELAAASAGAACFPRSEAFPGRIVTLTLQCTALISRAALRSVRHRTSRSSSSSSICESASAGSRN